MSRAIAVIESVYSLLLRLYPQGFRDEFSEEMRIVFRRSIEDALHAGFSPFLWVCARELLGLPLNLLQEFRHEFRKEGMNMETAAVELSTLNVDQKSSRHDALLATLPFLLFGLVCLLGRLNSHATIFLYAAADLLVLAGLVAGGLRGFPRWSFTFLGWAAIYSWLWTMLRLDGLIRNQPALPHGLVLGPLGLLPFFLALVLPLALTRSFTPLIDLVQGIWQDWTRLSLALFAFAGYAFMVFDENHHPWLALFMTATTLVMAAAIWSFMRAEKAGVRVLALLVGFVLSWVISDIAYSTWDAAAYYGLPQGEPQPLLTKVREILFMFLIWSALVFWPALLGLLRRISRAASG